VFALVPTTQRSSGRRFLTSGFLRVCRRSTGHRPSIPRDLKGCYKYTRTDPRPQTHHRRDARKTSPTPPFRPRLATAQRLPVGEKHTSTEKARVEGAVCLRIGSILEQKRKTLPM
ncbi:unnamed protein product, partial [Ectocarpus sp. 12 AP-2014]